MTRYTPPSIKDEGVESFLNRTRHLHKGLGWSDFKQRLDIGVSKKKIADDFGISRTQLYNWLRWSEK